MSNKMFNLVLCITVLVSLIGLAPTTVVQAATPQPETTAYPYATDHLIVKLRAEARVEKGTTSTHIASLDRALAEMKAVALEAVPGLPATYLVKLDSKSADILGAVKTLNADPAVEYAEPDYLAKFASAPDDPRYSEQWGLAKVQAEGAWDETMGSLNVVIAIIDSGIDLAHEDLSPNLWVNPGEISANSIDDDNNGFVDDVQGWNFVNGTNDVQDFIGHGSLVAGVAAARSNNTLGIAGMCGNCQIMPVKITQVSGFANYSDIAAGVKYAADKGAEVINLSVGGYADSITVKNEINAALSKGIVVVGGVGNDNKSDKFYPAAYDGVIAVAGTDAADVRVTSSNYGTWVDISAPGQNILSTTLGDYSSDTGTSYATPFVSGAAGLLLSLHPEWTPAMVRSQFLHTTDSIDSQNPGFVGMLGSGRLNVALALTTPPQPELFIADVLVNGESNGRPDLGVDVVLGALLNNSWLDTIGVSAVLSTSDPVVTLLSDTAEYGDVSAGSAVAGSPAFTIHIAPEAGYSHAINLSLHVVADGSAYSADLPFTITTRSANQNVNGTIGVDTTWTNDKVYIVTNNVGIAPGRTLTIQPGTVIRFNGNYAINVGGALIADGNAEQPIQFLSNTSSDWNRLYFDDLSADAVTDATGNYLSGNILRWVTVQGAAAGIACNNATPYLEQVTSDKGGLICPQGNTPVWIKNSRLSGTVNVSGIAPRDSSWVARPPMPLGGVDVASAAVNGKIYTFENNIIDSVYYYTTLNAYDPQTNTWQTRVNPPTAYTFLRAVALNGKIYVAGYLSPNATALWDYDPVTESWTPLASLATRRYSFSMAAANGKIYIFGGLDATSGDAVLTDAVSEYSPLTNTWSARTSMPVARYLTTAVTVDGQVYVIGGQNEGSALVTRYTPQNDTWQVLSDLPVNHRFHSAVYAAGHIYLTSCNDVCNNQLLHEYDQTADQWHQIVAVNSPYTRCALATDGGRVFVMGGGAGSGQPLTKNEELILPTSLWNSQIIDSTIHGDVTLPIWSRLTGNTIQGNVDLYFNGSGEVLNNTIIGWLGAGGLIQDNVIKSGHIGVYGVYSDSLVSGNTIEKASTWAIYQHHAQPLTITHNRLVDNADGIMVSNALVQGNLLGDTAGIGLQVNGSVAVSDNTFIGNQGSSIQLANPGEIAIHANNFVLNSGSYDIENLIPAGTLASIAAEDNWWGIIDSTVISERIFDSNDDYTLGTVLFDPPAVDAIQSAPAYVRSLTLDPDSPVGIQTVDFIAEFSRPMNTEVDSQLSFQSIQHKTWAVYNTGNSELPANYVRAIAVDADGSKWFGTDIGLAHFDGITWTVYNYINVLSIAIDADGSKWFGTNDGVAHFDGTTWTVYNTGNSGLPNNNVFGIAVDVDRSQWFGTNGSGAAHFDGTTWTVYNTYNSGLPNNTVRAIAVDADGSKWFGTEGGVAHFDGTTWTVYHTGNSELPNNYVEAMVIDADGSRWFGTWGGVAHFDGTTWTVYRTDNSGLPFNGVLAIAVDADGSKWFGTYSGGVAHFNDTIWTVYNNGNSGLPDPNDYVLAISVDVDGTKWFGTWSGGVGVLRNYPTHTIQDNPTWLDETHFQTSYDFTSLINRGDYRLTVMDALDSDGMMIVPDTSTTFSVDYAGEISDTTPPATPVVSAWGNDSLTQLTAQASANDPDSEIVGYRYAIGSSPGGSDVVNWTNTAYPKITRTGLILQPDQAYYVSFQARNLGGLWSDIGVSNGVVNGSLPNPVPMLTSIDPNSSIAGDPAFTLTVTGTNFVSNSVVRWNGSDRATTFIGATQLAAQIPAADIATDGDYPVTVFTPAPGGGTSNAVNFSVAVPNSPPVAVDDSYATDEDTELTIADPGVLGNDTDADGNPLTAVQVTVPDHGTIALNANGSFTYTPSANWSGMDSLTYKANDGTADSNVATVTLTVTAVNDVPVANDQSVSTTEDTAKGITLTATDPDDTTFTWTIVAAPANGALSGTVPNVTYTPTADYSGADSFTFKVNDGDADSNTATVSINVTTVNDPPVANAQLVSTSEDTSKGITLTATDLDDTIFTWTIITSPSHGSLSGTAPDITYTPAANYNGADSFTFKVNDGDADSNTATVSINITAVNDAPIAVDDSYSMDEDTVLSVAAPGVLSNDTDADSDPLTAVLISGPAHGMLTLNADGSFTYTPDANWYGSETFTYKANDGIADSNVVTVTITVADVSETRSIYLPLIYR